jgi:hypothetical protein
MFFKNNNNKINQNLTTIQVQKTYPQLPECLPIDKSIMLKKNNYIFCNDNDIFSENNESNFHDFLPEIILQLNDIQIKNIIYDKISYIKSFFIFIYNYITRFFIRINFFKYLPQIIK